MSDHKISPHGKTQIIEALMDLHDLTVEIGASQNFQFLMAGIVEAARLEFGRNVFTPIPACVAMTSDEFEQFMIKHIAEIPMPANNFHKL